MSYQVGQAVKIRWDKNTEYIGTFESQKGATIHTGGLFNANDSGLCNTESVRPATEAEILAEAVKRGWGLANKQDLFSPKKYHHIKKANSGKWYEHTKVEIDNNNLLPFCEEGLIAHRLITALNLAK